MNGGYRPSRVAKRSKRTANKLLLEIENDVKGYKGHCLFVTDDIGGYCDEPVSNNCHVVSESAVLDGLKDDKTKKVLELHWGVSQWRRLLFSGDVEQRVQDTTTFDPSEKTTGDACMGRFACKLHAHDDEFSLIDVAVPDFDDPVVRFLSGYRLVLFQTDLYRQIKRLHEKWDRNAMRNPALNNRVTWLREKRKVSEGLRRVKVAATLLGKNWYARETGGTFNLNLVSAQVLNFRSKLRLAGAAYSKATGVTVFPVDGDWHQMGVLYLTSESDQAGEDIDRLAGVARASEECDNYGVTVTNELMTNGWGVLAVSPKSYGGLNDQDRSTIRSLVARHSRHEDLLKPINPGLSRSTRRRNR